MPGSNISILCTRKLDPQLIKKAREQNIYITDIPFIEIKPASEASYIEEVLQLSLQKVDAVFTSVNAVDSLARYIDGKPNWEIFCIGGATKEAVIKYFSEEAIVASAKNASLLARK